MSFLLKGRCQVWFPGPESWELWFIDGWKRVDLLGTCDDARFLAFEKRGGTRILALPSNRLQSRFFCSASSSETRLRRDAISFLKQDGTGGDLAGLGVQPLFGLPPRAFGRIDIPRVDCLPIPFAEDLEPDVIVPAASLLPLPTRSVSIWKELGEDVVGFERNGLTASYFDPRKRKEPQFTRFLRKLIREQESEEVVERVRSVHLWNDEDHLPFEEFLGIPIRLGRRPEPTNIRGAFGIRPSEIRDRQFRKRKKNERIRNLSLAISGLVLFASALVVIDSISGAQTEQQRKRLADLEAQAQVVRSYQTRWDELSPAVDRNASVLEAWRQLISIPGSEQIEVNRLTVANDEIRLSCLAENLTVARRFMDDVTGDRNFVDYSWFRGEPELQTDGTFLFELKGQK